MNTTRRTIRYIVIAAVLMGLGWSAGRAQTSGPDFEIVVDSPPGATTIQCVRGCKLAWVERGVNPNSGPELTFTYACSSATHCSSSRVGGWLTP